jgi:uncharacterized protein
MRFLVDGMLGGLARWLRILGQDVTYDVKTKDNELLRIAREQNRILLTRDNELQRRALANNIGSALIRGQTERERLAEIAKTFGLSLEVSMIDSRCPECGSKLNQTTKREIADEVPEATLTLYDQFWICAGPNCRKVYWIGSHWRRIRQTLEEARKLASGG